MTTSTLSKALENYNKIIWKIKSWKKREQREIKKS